MSKSGFNNKKKAGVVIAIIFIFYAVIMAFLFRRCVPIDSDYSNLVLEGNELVQGNFFLKGWNLTGISFITTDLLFFVIGAIIRGVSPGAYYIAAGLMTAAAVLLGGLLCEPFRQSWRNIILYLLLSAFPGVFALSGLRAHTGAVCWVLISIFFIDRYLKRRHGRDAVIACVFLTLGCLGDMLTMIIGILPILILVLVRWFRASGFQDILRDKASQTLTLVSIISVVLSVLLDKLYFTIGEANKNSFLGTKVFEGIENWGNKFTIYIKSVFMLEDAAFFGHQLISVHTAGFFFNSIIVMVGIGLVFYYIVRFVRYEECDYIVVLLSLGYLVISLIFVITNISVNVISSRYLSYSPILFGILIVRFADRNTSSSRGINREILLGSLFIIAGISFLFRVYSYAETQNTPVEQYELVRTLKNNNLKNGYSSFWNASISTVISKGDIKIRAIQNVENTDTSFDYHNWFCKDEWYQEDADFVVAQEGDLYGVTPDNVRLYFGEPAEIIDCGKWRILVYERNLSYMLTVNKNLTVSAEDAVAAVNG